ncbi:MAG: DUF2157 domain-containing protein [Elusimicrobia bacterium]|nr:DUF2157 domain-containing protein [Elusimicrobiota bacterium]
MELLVVLMVLAVPVFGIWLVVKVIQWLINAFSPKKATGKAEIKCPECFKNIGYEYEGKPCPSCGTLIMPHYISEWLQELKETKNRLLLWHSQGKISAEEYNKLDKLCMQDREQLMSELREKRTRPEPQPQRSYVPPLRDMPMAMPQEPEVPHPQPEPEQPVVLLEPASIPTSALLIEPKSESLYIAPAPIPEPIYTAPKKIQPAYNRAEEKHSSAFLSERNIKLMLNIGVALFALGASIFVKNNWDLIPGTLKLASLLFVTIATYLAGFFLVKKKKIPKTATTLMFLGSLLIPYNFYAVNNFSLLGFTIDWRQIWLLSSIVCLPLYIFNCRFLESRVFYYASLGAYTLIVYFSSSLLQISSLYYPLIMTVACAIIPLFFINYLYKKGLLKLANSTFDTHVFTNIISFISFLQLLSLAVARTNDMCAGTGYAVLCIFYLIDSLMVDDNKILYPAGISFYAAAVMFSLNSKPPFLNIAAVVSTVVVIIELLLSYVKMPGRDKSFFRPFNTINQVIATITAVGIFSLEISRFIATYFMDYNMDQSIIYQLRTIVLITTTGLVYFILLQMRERKKVYSHILIGYFYILGFTIMQAVIDISYHAFSFMVIGAVALIAEKQLCRKTVNEALFSPLKSFSYLFTILMSIYIVMKYVTTAHLLHNYLLFFMRTGGLFLYFGLALYLYRERIIIQIMSFLYYLGVYIVAVNLLGFDQYSLIFSVATLPVFGLYFNFRNSEYAGDLLVVEAVALIVSFSVSLSKGFYIYPTVIDAGGWYFYNVISLGVILAITAIHEFTMKRKEPAYVTGVLFYLIIFVLAYPYMSIQATGVVMAGACLSGLGISLLLSKKDDLAALSDPLDVISNIVQVAVIGGMLGNGFYLNNNDQFIWVIVILGLQALYYSLFAWFTKKHLLGYIGGFLGYLAIIVSGVNYSFTVATFGYYILGFSFLQLLISKIFNMNDHQCHSRTYFCQSIAGGLMSAVAALYFVALADNSLLAPYLILLPLQVVYFSIVTAYSKEAMYAYPATIIFYFLVFVAGKYLGLALPTIFLAATIISLMALGFAYYMRKIREDLFVPIFATTQGNVIVLLTLMSLNVYYFHSMQPKAILFTIMFQIVFYAINAYIEKKSYYIYPSGGLLYLLIWLLFPQLNWHFAYMGMAFLGMSCLYTAATFFMKKQGKEDSAGSFYLLGQLAVVLVIINLVSNSSFFMREGFGLFSLLLMIMALVYIASSFIYRRSAFTYVGALILMVLLLFTGVHWQFIFFQYNLIFILFAGFIYLVARLMGSYFGEDDVISEPLSKIAVFLIVGSFISSMSRFFYFNFSNSSQMISGGELNVALLITFIVTAVYGGISYYNKDVRYLYFTLGSFVLLYIMLLKKMTLPLNSTSLAVLAPVLTFGDAFFYRRQDEKFAQPFFLFTNSLLALAFMQSWQNDYVYRSVACVLASLVYGSMLFYRRQFIYSYLAQALFGIGYFSALKYIPKSAYYWPYYLLLLNLAYLGCGQLGAVFKEDIDQKPFRYMGLVTMIMALFLSFSHLEYAYIIFSIYAVLCFIWGVWQRESIWQKISYNLLLAAYELMIYYLNVKTVEFYTVPLGLALLGWGIACQNQDEKKSAFYTLGALAIYLPGLYVSVKETWGLHGIFLGCISMILLFAGIKLRSKVVVVFSSIVLLLNGIIQSHSYMLTIPRWVYMASGGTFLIVMGMLFEMKRERLQQLGKNLVEKWRDWE